MVADGAARASVCCFMPIRSIRGPNGRIVDYAVLGGDSWLRHFFEVSL